MKSPVDDALRAIDTAIREMDRLRAINQQLLAALKRLRDLPVDCSQQDDIEAWGVAHSAIAKAERTL